MDYSYFAKYLPVSERDINWQLYRPSAGRENISRAVNYPTRAADHPPKYLFDWSMGRVFDEFQLHYIPREQQLVQKAKVTLQKHIYRLSIENPYYFSRIFKKKTGLSPSAWH